MPGKDDIEKKVAALGDLSREELVALWRKNFGLAPPKGVHKELLIRAAAFHLQQKHFGGMSGEAKRLLKAAMRETAKTMAASRTQAGHVKMASTSTGDGRHDRTDLADLAGKQALPTFAPARQRQEIRAGARLIRDWNGRNHVVDVVENGFVYAGSRYRSLSKIAREITGTNWSGPRFFGL